MTKRHNEETAAPVPPSKVAKTAETNAADVNDKETMTGAYGEVAAEECRDEDEEEEEEVPLVPDGSRLRSFPQFMPTENRFPRDTYYVRDCYREYYELVLKRLDKCEGVAITGTPGIGKSVSLQEYKRQYPHAFITMAAYTSGRNLRAAMVIQGDTVVEERTCSRAKAIFDTYGDSGMHNLWLLDGPPNGIPHFKRWVAFSTPNEEWRKDVYKNLAVCAEVYMPPWTLEELRHAAIELGAQELLFRIAHDEQLEIPLTKLRKLGVAEMADLDRVATKLNYRFAVFGGIARVCLATDPWSVPGAFEELMGELDELDYDDVTRAFQGKRLRTPVHTLIHYMPVNYEQNLDVVASTRALLHYKPVKYNQKIYVAASTLFEIILEKREQQIWRTLCSDPRSKYYQADIEVSKYYQAGR